MTESTFENREWREWLKRLQNFRREYGHSDVPPKWPADPKLARWAAKIRSQPDSLFLDQLCQLDELRFNFRSERKWMSRFVELVAFRHKHGHANVPAHGPKGLPLGQWLSFQRSHRDSLAMSRRRLLDKAGIAWTPLETQWEEMFEKLAKYASVHSHCRVTDAQDRKLALWVANVRKRRKVTPLQKRRLDRIGFDWDVAASDWAHRMADLRAFAKRFGHTNVPVRWSENRTLGGWLADLRSGRRKIPAPIKRELEAMGIDWRPWRSQQWERRFLELLSYKQKHGHCNVPIDYRENMELGRWVGTQRMQRHAMSPDRRRRLGEIGFVWKKFEMSPRHDWDYRFQELLAFREKHGHTNVPQRWPENRTLAFWVSRQRARDKPKLTPAQLQRLNRIGFAWSVRECRWRERVAELKTFYDRFGHSEVPKSRVEYRQLATWTYKVRDLKRAGKLSKEKVREISSLGFRWGYLPEPEKQCRAQQARALAESEKRVRL